MGSRTVMTMKYMEDKSVSDDHQWDPDRSWLGSILKISRSVTITNGIQIAHSYENIYNDKRVNYNHQWDLDRMLQSKRKIKINTINEYFKNNVTTTN